MTSASPRNCSGVRSPRGTSTSTVTKPSWRWARTLVRANASNSRAVAVGRGDLDRRGRRVGLLVVLEQQAVERVVALVDPVALELLLDHLAEGVHPDAVDEHLDPGAGAVLAQVVLAVEDAQARPR